MTADTQPEVAQRGVAQHGVARPGAPDVPWLTDEQQEHWRALMALLMTLPPALDAQIRRDGGLNTFEYHVLAALSEARARTLVLSDLAELARGSLSRLSHAVTRLERAGWVERRSCTEGGGRRTEARLTPAGLEKLEQVAPGHVREVRRLVVDVLAPEQLAALADAARAVRAGPLAGAGEGCRAVDC
ncbi:MarR family winged helix-turn-helix transcriptional regulator [Vallicoccus soli]|uniref:MarR family winged helix-turn-helix transcriptional regulator n=1 Tax=Vallicoccus soli TaxID=2339232 RepID=UPI001C49A623|nr:transcriptional regulator [Vallicoccus soli]